MTVIGSAILELRGDSAHFVSEMRRAREQFQQVGQKMQAVGRTLSTRVTLPLAAVGAGSVKAFSDFDAAMTQSLAIMGDVSESMRGEMSAAAREVSRTTTTSATEAAEAYFFLASAGLDAEQSVAALPQVAKFAQAGMFDMARATDLATDAQSALGLTVSDAVENLENLERVTDTLVRANTLANATVEQFSTALTTEAGAAMKTFGIDVEEGVAVLSAFADQGIKGERAGSGFSRILRLMSQAAVNNAEEMDALGIEFFDAEGNMRNMADVVESLTDVLAPMSDAQRAAALESIGFTARVQGIIQPLLGTSEAIREYETELRGAAGFTDEVSQNQLQSFGAQMEIARNNVVNAAIVIGEVLAPAVTGLSGALATLAGWFEGLDPLTQSIIVGVAGIAAAIGPLAVALGTVVTLLPVMATGLGVIMSPITLGIAAFLSLVAAGHAVVDNWNVIKFETQRLVETVREWLGERFTRIVDSLREKVEAVGGFFRDLKDRVVGNSYIPEMVDGIDDEFGRLDAVMVRVAEASTEAVARSFERMAARAAEATEVTFERMENIDLSGTFEEFVEFAEAVDQQAMRLANSISSNVGDAIADLATGAASFGEAFSRAAVSIVRDLARMIARALVFKAIMSALPGFGEFFAAVGAVPIPRAAGGMAMPGQSYRVGEQGPEVITPLVPSVVTPNHQTGGDIQLTVNVPAAKDLITFTRDRQWRDALAETVEVLKADGVRFDR